LPRDVTQDRNNNVGTTFKGAPSS